MERTFVRVQRALKLETFPAHFALIRSRSSVNVLVLFQTADVKETLRANFTKHSVLLQVSFLHMHS